MDEYIKRAYAVDAVLDVYYDTPDIDLSGEKFEAAIFKIQAADVAPVRHGYWRPILHKDGKTDYECSCCLGIIMDVPDDDEHDLCAWCSMCGAKMDLEANHETGQHLEGEAGLAVGV